MIDILPTDLHFYEAIAFFRSKGFEISPTSWRDVWKEAHARAFTVAQVTRMDVLKDIRKEVQRSIEMGLSLNEFKKNLIPVLQAKGWWATEWEKARVELPDGTTPKRLKPWRLKVIYSANMQTAYSVGRYKQMMEVAASFPVWVYKAILDKKTRWEHRAQHDKAYDHRHPFWKRWFPPNGWFCRCYVKALSAEEARSRGYTIQTADSPSSPDEGWDYHVGEAGLDAFRPDLSKYPQGMPSSPVPKPLDVKSLDDVSRVVKDKCRGFGIDDVRFEDTGSFASTDTTGRITISTRNFPEIEYSPARDLMNAMKHLGSEPVSFQEELAVQTLWHEVLHNRQLIRATYEPETPAATLMETLTEWVSRRTYGEILDILGGFTPVHQSAIAEMAPAYAAWVARFDALLRRLGLDPEDALPDILRAYITEEYSGYIPEVAKALARMSDPAKVGVIRDYLENISSGSRTAILSGEL